MRTTLAQHDERLYTILLPLYAEARPDRAAHPNSTIGPKTTLDKFAWGKEDAFQRAVTQLKKEIEQNKARVLIPLPSNTKTSFLKQQQKNFELMDSRNKKYGESWKVLTIPSIANLIEMKMNRIAHMDVKQLDPKIEDELRDTANYAIFALIKLENEKQA